MNTLASSFTVRDIFRRACTVFAERTAVTHETGALAYLGASALTLNIRLHPSEIDYCLQSGKPTVLIYSGALADTVAKLQEKIPNYWCTTTRNYHPSPHFPISR